MTDAATSFNATIIQNNFLNPDLFVMSVSPDGWEIPDFKAGQYCAIGLPSSSPRTADAEPDPEGVQPNSWIKRAYSVASSPNEKKALEFYIVLVKEGALTPRLASLRPGSKIWVSQKFTGTFTADELPDECNIILYATGTGLAPYVSMLHSDLMRPKRRIAVLHGVRHPSDLGYRDELEALQRFSRTKFLYIPVISRPTLAGSSWSGRTGYIQDVWQTRDLETMWETKLTPQNTHVFICGNPAMIEAVSAILQSEGFTTHSRQKPGQIHIEKYW